MCLASSRIEKAQMLGAGLEPQKDAHRHRSIQIPSEGPCSQLRADLNVCKVAASLRHGVLCLSQLVARLHSRDGGLLNQPRLHPKQRH